MDTLTRTERSKRMALIHGKNTKPELLVRKIARSCGYKFRLHVPYPPGKPDMVFPKLRKIIFMHCCSWAVCSLAHLTEIEGTLLDPQLGGKSWARPSEHRAATSLIQDAWSR